MNICLESCFCLCTLMPERVSRNECWHSHGKRFLQPLRFDLTFEANLGGKTEGAGRPPAGLSALLLGSSEVDSAGEDALQSATSASFPAGCF